MFFRKTLNEIWIATDRSQVEDIDPETLNWSRWAFGDPDTHLKLRPLMPDLQLTVRPETPFRLTTGTQVRVYTRVPIWVGVYAADRENHRLQEIPTVQLSKTWFGDMEHGRLSYWVSTRARRTITPDMLNPYVAICTLNIRNESDEDLHIEKMNLLAERLSLYLKDDQLWSDEMDVVYKGGDQHSEITMKGEPPEYVSDAIFVMEPRNPVKHSMAERILKEIHFF